MADLVTITNRGITSAETQGQTSNVGEPSVCAVGDEVFLTGNWYAVKSLDGGSSWGFVSPRTTTPSANAGFCCDQLALYDPSRDVVFWLLQYSRDAAGNTIRIAVAPSGALATDDFHWFDFTPAAIDPSWSHLWFDYEDFALSDNFLHVTSNLFTNDSSPSWERAAVLRLPLDDLASGAGLTVETFTTTENGSLRCVHGATDTMYFADNIASTSELRLFSWPESSSTVSSTDIDIAAWQRGSYSAPGPDGNNWLSRCDDRINGAWRAGGTLGFMWTANRRTGRPFPYVKVVRIDEASQTLLDEPDIWNDEFAFAYPAAAPRADGTVGVTMMYGGGSRFPGMLFGVRDPDSDKWKLRSSRVGTHGPGDLKSGDYTTVRPAWPAGDSWVASGFTLQGGASRNFIEPQFVRFGFQ